MITEIILPEAIGALLSRMIVASERTDQTNPFRFVDGSYIYECTEEQSVIHKFRRSVGLGFLLVCVRIAHSPEIFFMQQLLFIIIT